MGCESVAFYFKPFCGDAGFFEFADVLFAEAFVGCDEDDVVQGVFAVV